MNGQTRLVKYIFGNTLAKREERSFWKGKRKYWKNFTCSLMPTRNFKIVLWMYWISPKWLHLKKYSYSPMEKTFGTNHTSTTKNFNIYIYFCEAVWDLSSLTGDWTCAPCNHWTTGKSQQIFFSSESFCFFLLPFFHLHISNQSIEVH